MPVPNEVGPSKNVTVPVGVPAPGAVTDTIAVSVNGWPAVDGFGDGTTATVVAAMFTTWDTGLDVLLTKFVSPAYTAVIEDVPKGRAEVMRLAVPPLNVPVPSNVVPCMNETVSPFGGVTSPEVTWAVNVTGCPYTDGFAEEASVVVVPGARMNP